jgi:hypothetical protein
MTIAKDVYCIYDTTRPPSALPKKSIERPYSEMILTLPPYIGQLAPALMHSVLIGTASDCV